MQHLKCLHMPPFENRWCSLCSAYHPQSNEQREPIRTWSQPFGVSWPSIQLPGTFHGSSISTTPSTPQRHVFIYGRLWVSTPNILLPEARGHCSLSPWTSRRRRFVCRHARAALPLTAQHNHQLSDRHRLPAPALQRGVLVGFRFR